MKQNEKFLVYAVTGFLVVILAIAILFGKEVPRQAPIDGQPATVVASAPPSLEDVLNRRAAPQPETPAKPADGTPSGDKAGDPSPAAEPATPAPAGEQPLAANVQLLPPSASALVTEKLGLSRRDRDCRVVRARAGDSLGALVQKWCGSLDYLEPARSLNEELTTLRVGQEIWLPWVEDEALLAAFEKSHPVPSLLPSPKKIEPAPSVAATTPAVGNSNAAAPIAAAMTPSAATPAAATARKYTVKTGDSLWKIAEREVGKKQAKSFLDKLLELNPGLESDRIREGQSIQLPAK